MTHNDSKNRKRLLWTVPLILLCAIIAYIFSSYKASDAARTCAKTDAYELEISGRNVLFFIPDGFTADDTASQAEAAVSNAIIIYPGGKVEYESYAPLCKELADRGIICALVDMPHDLAIYYPNAAEDIITYLNDIYDCNQIYIGGHSLGGAIASDYALNNNDKLTGLFLLGSYATKDLTGTGLKVISIYGSEDQVMNRKNYDKFLVNLPSDYTEVVIQGGCHSYFGDYGHQRGDGEPTISREEQLEASADAIMSWIND